MTAGRQPAFDESRPTQLRLLPGLTPEQVVAEAHDGFGPFIARLCLISGGRDSSVLAHRCRDHYDQLVFVDTGTALPGVTEHVQELARWLDKPLRIMHTPPSEYDRLILGSNELRSNGEPDVGAGFPGPGLHGTCYTRLKERQLEDLLRETKIGQPRRSRVLMLTGLRRAESQRRRSRPQVSKKGARIFANPLIDWPNSRVYDYAIEHSIPESDIAALLHRSGECNCGAFAAEGEREQLKALFPEWFSTRIAPLERAAALAGFAACKWGQGDVKPMLLPTEVGELCSDCQLRIEAA